MVRRKGDDMFALPLPFTTFDDVERLGLEIEVACKCGRRRVLDVMAPELRDRAV